MKHIAQYIFVITFIWTGFILAISFMEAWVKFQAPSITLAQGLDVGRHVFFALSVVEKAFLVLQFGALIYFHDKPLSLITLGGVTIILLIQWFILLPILDARAAAIIAKVPISHSSPHLYFVLIEALKVVLLIILGISQVKDFLVRQLSVS